METEAKCPKCKYEWITKSEMFLVSCPKCGSKVRIKSLKKKEMKGGRKNE